jgi:2-polyprenyl-3-methyl-5-hydroxy-6-metoxy-1,4-benzoquinol methylase
MCGAGADQHAMVGMRLNKSQGFRPREVSGVAVAIKRCKSCGLIFSDPHPAPQSITDHYELSADTYFDESQRTFDPNYFGAEIDTAKQLLGFVPGMRALDIGVGMGKGMRALSSAGFDTWGIEPSKSFLNYAIDWLAIEPARILNETVESADFPSEKFDFIVFGAVLEHLHSPARALSAVLKWLKPGGVIHAEVPSSNYWMSKFTNLFFTLNMTSYVTHLSPMHPPYHLYEFTQTSFEENGRRLGYDLARYAFKAGPIYHLPAIFHRPLHAMMKMTNSEMQLTVFLQRSHGP